MNNLNIRKASLKDAELAGYMTYDAYKTNSADIFGKIMPREAERCFSALWRNGNNRFSYNFSMTADDGRGAIGIITFYDLNEMRRLALPTFWALLKLRGWKFFTHFLGNISNFLYYARNMNVKSDELYIATLSTAENARKKGIGRALLEFACNEAKKRNLKRVALHVDAKNLNALAFYEKCGFSKESTTSEKAAFFKMTKNIL